MTQLRESLASVRRRIGVAAAAGGRSGADVTLVVVTKTRSTEDVARLYELGVRDFGENRADELAAKAPKLPDDIRWHFIGSLQSRSVPLVAAHAAVLHSLDRAKLIRKWAGASDAPAYLQVNVSGEVAKHGYRTDEALEAATEASQAGVVVAGLMTMAPLGVDPSEAQELFEKLARLRDIVAAAVPSATGLSMGMTDDFEPAVVAGATAVRIGRAIFTGEPD